jgi:hypothetical protein
MRTVTDWRVLFDLLQAKGVISDRKFRLFGVACCRQVWHLLCPRQYRKVVLVAERYADGEAVARSLEKARRDAYYAPRSEWSEAAGPCCLAAISLGWPLLSACTAVRIGEMVEEALILEAAELEQVPGPNPMPALVNDIFGNRFREATFDPAWLRSLQGLAQQVYENRDFARMPELAKALEEAGCTDANILNHGREETVHVSGCWVLDLILEKK